MRSDAAWRFRRAYLLLSCLVAVLCVAAIPADASDATREALLKARAEQRKGSLGRALKTLRKLERGPLAPHGKLIAARWLLEAKRPADAEGEAKRGLALDPGSELRAELERTRSRAALVQEDLAGAYSAAQRAWEASRNPERAASIALDLARELEKRKLPGDALITYRRIWERWPKAEVSGVAFERSRFLTRGTGAPAVAVDPLLTYADILRKRHRCDTALSVYEEVLSRGELSRARQAEASEGRADCLFQRRRYNEARQAYLELAKADPDNLEPRIRAARCYARQGLPTKALKEFWILREKGSVSQRARIDYLRAIVLRRSAPKAHRGILRLIEKQRAVPSLAAQARWRLAWEDLLAERYQTASTRLRRMVGGSLWDLEVQRARYWLGVAQSKLGNARGEVRLRELADRVPLSFYGLMAADRLGLQPKVDEGFLRADHPQESYEPAERASWLIEANFPEIAAAELESWYRSHQLTRAERAVAAPLLHAVGDHFRGARLLIDAFGGSFERGVDPEWRAVWENAWPQPFPTEVKAATEEFELDRAMVYAVMREESTYRPAVASPAGALGLMQIIPPTANRIAKELGVSKFQVESLLTPKTSIRFGTYYLSFLMKRFKGSRPRAIAAYNAGPDAVLGWIEQDGSLPLDAFVDSIPYPETRRYLRKVYRSWRVYQILYPTVPGPATQAARLN